MPADNNKDENLKIILTVFFIWIILVLLLFFLYKWLNRETQDQYTIHRLIYMEGGLRDRTVQVIEYVTSLPTRIHPQNHDEEEAIDGDEEEDREEGEGDREGGCHNEVNEEEDKEEVKDDSSDDYSSIDLRERVKQKNNIEEKTDTEEKKTDEEQKEDTTKEEKEDEHKQEEDIKDEERVGLLVNIKPFSGSAIWSEEQNKEESNVTAL